MDIIYLVKSSIFGIVLNYLNPEQLYILLSVSTLLLKYISSSKVWGKFIKIKTDIDYISLNKDLLFNKIYNGPVYKDYYSNEYLNYKYQRLNYEKYISISDILKMSLENMKLYLKITGKNNYIYVKLIDNYNRYREMEAYDYIYVAFSGYYPMLKINTEEVGFILHSFYNCCLFYMNIYKYKNKTYDKESFPVYINDLDTNIAIKSLCKKLNINYIGVCDILNSIHYKILYDAISI